VTSSAILNNPNRVALLLMDFQNGVLDTIGDCDEVLSGAGAALSWARRSEVQVAHVRVAFTATDFDEVPSHNTALAPVALRRFLADNSAEAAIHARLAPLDNEIVVRKTRFGAFSTTDLHTELLKRGIDTLVLAGVSTSGVVLSTAREAVDRDYHVHVLVDAVADHDPRTHHFLIEQLLPRSTTMISTRDLPNYGGNGREATPDKIS